jgi:hypothetical protein
MMYENATCFDFKYFEILEESYVNSIFKVWGNKYKFYKYVLSWALFGHIYIHMAIKT